MRKKIKRLQKQLDILTKTLGFVWVDCPQKEDDPPCKNGYWDFGRGPRECPKCYGAGKIIKKVDYA